MKKFLIVLFALAMFLFGKFFCEVKPEWSEQYNSQHEIRNTAAQ